MKSMLLVSKFSQQDEIDKANKAIDDMLAGKDVSIHNASDAFFSQLRLRVAQSPTLASRIFVNYTDEHGVVSQVGLTEEDETKWPLGFMDELWVLETKIIKTRRQYEADNVQPPLDHL